jgi:hypothetical protein
MTSRKVHNRTLTVLLACVATVLWSFPAQAQLAGATLSGVVKDTSRYRHRAPSYHEC